MKYREKNDIIDFFDISILMPFYKRLNDFKKVLPKNARYFERNGIEIVIILDHQEEEKGLLRFIEQYPFINFKVIVNRKEHEWRNPCKVLNVGIKHASFKYILVLDPEVELITDVIYRLRYMIYHYPSTYATGVVAFISHSHNVDALENLNWMSYGSIMVAKSDLISVRGYDENHNQWGGEDDQIRRKLDLLGLRKIELLDARTVHRENTSDGHRERSARMNSMPIRHLKKILYPREITVNSKNWGQEFKELIWSWKENKSYSQLEKYLLQFKDSSIIGNKAFHNSFKIIVLIQTRNESKNMPEILSHLNNHCDGYILLDDGSTDDTYEKALHPKILVKAKKVYKGYFDDLENRNILLRLASFFKSEWFIFIDADERIDSRYSNVWRYTDSEKINVYRFHLVDVWDNPSTYRVDLPDRRKNGITKRMRMFRNLGNLQIHADREIHFPSIPFKNNVGLAKILLLHYGNYDGGIREKKYELYTSQDSDGKKQGHSYKFLKEKNVKLKNLEDIGSNEIMES